MLPQHSWSEVYGLAPAGVCHADDLLYLWDPTFITFMDGSELEGEDREERPCLPEEEQEDKDEGKELEQEEEELSTTSNWTATTSEALESSVEVEEGSEMPAKDEASERGEETSSVNICSDLFLTHATHPPHAQ